ncbi:MAG: Unknown protein [uncultured Thiotrichaceae bacterium]|uniref:Peptidase M12B domain-containing protein n=1 Tax=uncultured Thiotrichaceae bacterium TaxID=298394 RepID=A0A6S6T7G6_9GAMM|nr:MAG: Unknown protein [uncultured Thiotrichaceae bacterium]
MMANHIAPPLLFTLAVSLMAPLYSASLWEPIHVLQRSKISSDLKFLPSHYSLQTLDESKMRKQLTTTTSHGELTKQTLEVPLPDGEFIQLRLTKKIIMEPALSAKYPAIKTFSTQGINNPHISGVIGINDLGFHGMLFTEDGRRVFLDRRVADGENYYISYYDTDYHPVDKEVIRCNNADHDHSSLRSLIPRQVSTKRVSDSIRTYRIAIAATGEYTLFHGGTKSAALSAITTTLARVNEIYERDLSINMTLAAGTEDIIFTDPTTDPFTDDDSDELYSQSQTEINARIGPTNYDIGHTFSIGSIGTAGRGVVCNDKLKALGITGSSNPQGDTYDIDYVSHEIGHQFGGRHTFNAQAGDCQHRSNNTAFEPGSGSTIMSYAGLCEENNLQNNTDAMFHTKSIEEISAFINNPLTGGSCGTTIPTDNSQPVANAGANYTIPVSTPFELSGSATDVDDGDTLSYSWEQIDSGTASDVNIDMGDNAIFRTFLPISSSIRTIPKLSDLLTGTTSKGEILPTTARTINFALVVRDQNGGVATDSMQVTVDNSGGAFAITSHNSANLLTAGETTNVSWDSANTASAPISCPTVDILLSTDSGNTFPTTLANATANDGEQMVSIPEAITQNSTSRLKIACNNNIFFDISDTDISIEPLANDINIEPPATDLDTSIQLSQNPGSESEDKSGGGSSSPLLLLCLCLLFGLRRLAKTSRLSE